MKQNNYKCIILCGGKGTRMQSENQHKVCFGIQGRPAIYHSIDRYKKAGLTDFTVVVGSMAEQVMGCISRQYDGVSYAFQTEALGTGNAARCGYDSIKELSDETPLFITMGDKIISSDAVIKLMDAFENTGDDLVFAVQPREQNVLGGHIAKKSRKVCGIVESLDIRKADIYGRLLDELKNDINLDVRNYIEDISTGIASERKRSKVLKQMQSVITMIEEGNKAEAMKFLETGSRIPLGKEEFTPDELDESEHVNSAVYIFKPSAFEYGLEAINTDNASGEEYLTDMVTAICSKPDMSSSVVIYKNYKDILTYNDVPELLRVEKILSEDPEVKVPEPEVFKEAYEWIRLFTDIPDAFKQELEDIYGADYTLIEERRRAYLSVLNRFIEKFGNKKVLISRAPGRVNLMGRHIEHRGGDINVISISKEVIAVAGYGNGDIRITNTNPFFKDREFNVRDHFRNIKWTDWLTYLDNKKVAKLILSSKGDWLNYVKAPVIKLQHTFRSHEMCGMDIAYTGNIPIAAGLSSSSAIVVATAEAATILNGLEVHPNKFVDLCGEGEWFVGSRGGAGDHAAMKFGQRGFVANLGFLPFGFKKAFKFPEGYKLIIANSFIKANKTTNAKDVFNQRIAAYEFGLMLLKEYYPQHEDKIEHIRDINPEHLGVSEAYIYEMLKSLPEKAKLKEIKNILPLRYHPRIEQIMKTHEIPEFYRIRQVCMFGIAECRRAAICGGLLEDNKIEAFSKMMNISHNGDRVAENDKNYDSSYPDFKLDKLISENSHLEFQPGGYACSTPEIDRLVDIAKNCDGVAGVQLSGAGLGGCIMVMVEEDKIDILTKTLIDEYYEGDSSGISVCIPVKGSGVIKFVNTNFKKN